MGALRLLLAASVVAAHTAVWPHAFSGVGGVVAVETFFVISGFYMTLVLTETYKGRKKQFYLNRFLRIYPEYWAIALLSITAKLIGGDGYREAFSKVPGLAQALIATASTGIFGTDTVLFLRIDAGSIGFGDFQTSAPSLHSLLVVPQAWTLSLELMFYLLAPWLVTRPTRYLITGAAVCLGAKLLGAGLFAKADDPWTYRFFGFEIAFFLVGILLARGTAVAPQYVNLGAISKSKWRSLVPCLAVFLLTPQLSDATAGASAFVRLYLVPLLLVVALSAIIPTLYFAFANSQVDAKLGAYSYPVYLCHILVLETSTSIFAGPVSSKSRYQSFC